ncbi:hypothetical protein [Streptomyces sp. NPDC001744]|uniref:hypothetical protein n=1 Tax=Streptomyces sp. NPDC001744 TaxID=3364606 RepID=UPI00369502EA
MARYDRIELPRAGRNGAGPNQADVAVRSNEWPPRMEPCAPARAVFAGYAAEHGGPAELRVLLDAPHVPAKANLLLRRLDTGGAGARCVPLPDPLRGGASR